MSVAKVIELSAEGETIESAIDNAVEAASKSIKGITGVNVENIKAMVDDNRVKSYRVLCKVSFIVKIDE